jgi:hypothetical protein
MPFDLSSINISLIGWIFILAAVIVLAGAIVHFFGHLLHLIIRGCGVILVAIALLYVLHLLKLI